MTPEHADIAQKLIRADIENVSLSYKFANNVAQYVPSTGIMTMGALLAHSSAATGRLDLLVGGSLLALLGAGIADISSGKNFLSRAFSKAASLVSGKKKDISQSTVLATIGLGACAVLGGGEAYDFLSHYQGDLMRDLFSGKLWDTLQDSPSGEIIYANAIWFAAASALNIPQISNVIRKVKGASQNNILHVQNTLGSIGAIHIMAFAQQAGLPAAEAVAALQVLTNTTGSLGLIASDLHIAPLSNKERCNDIIRELRLYDAYMEETQRQGDKETFLRIQQKEQSGFLVRQGHMSQKDVDALPDRAAGYAAFNKKYSDMLDGVDDFDERARRLEQIFAPKSDLF